MGSLSDATVIELKRGYVYREDLRSFACLYCEQRCEQGEIYRVGDRLLDARRAVDEHVAAEHGSAFHALAEEDKRTTGLTDVQRGYMQRFYEGQTDQEIAQAVGASQSTVRYQRFMLRERAKQARAFLALFELMEGRAKDAGHPPIHRGATMVDERYVVTDEEERRILAAAFSSLDPLVLTSFSPRQKKKLVVLRVIARQFDPGIAYSEKQMNEILRPIYPDFATIRRYLIEYGFMERTPDGSEYRLK